MLGSALHLSVPQITSRTHSCPPAPPQIIPNTEVVVGDVMLVDTGDKIIADGVMIDGHHLVRAAGWGY